MVKKHYDNRQVQMIYDIESLIPEHHVARVVDEMVEAIQMNNCFHIIKAAAEVPIIPK
jgi:transposase